MHKFMVNLALNIIFNLMKGDYEMMAMLYASKICFEAVNPKTGKAWEFSDVPSKLKAQVAEILINDCNLADLVPTQFGGTAEV